MTSERFKRIVSVLIAVVAALTTVIAFVQSEAGQKDDRAARESQQYAMEALGRTVSGRARLNFDYNNAYQGWNELNLLAGSAEGRDDPTGAARYSTVRDELPPLSPLLQSPYFDPASGALEAARYEADIYLVEVTALSERYTAAADVQQAWDGKANTYIVHLTLLAVALFLLGMAITINGALPRLIFSVSGVVFAVVATIWAGTTWAQPVYDLRQQGNAIDAYAQGVGLAYQGRSEDAVQAFTQAVSAAPEYVNAYAERARAYDALGKLQEAAADYEQARRNGDKRAGTAGDLAWLYYRLGRHQDAIAMNQEALAGEQVELWIQFDLGLAQLAAGDIEGARSSYDTGMQDAIKSVGDARAAGRETDTSLWWSLDDAAISLDGLIASVDAADDSSYPPRSSITNPDTARTAAEELIRKLKSLAVALELTGAPPQGELTAQVSALSFGTDPVYDDEGTLQDYTAVDDDTFPYGTDQVVVLFDYSGIRQGQEVFFKVYVNGEEDPSWRLAFPWELEESGSAYKELSLAYSDTFVLAPGEYVIEMYLDTQLAGRGTFYVSDQE